MNTSGLTTSFDRASSVRLRWLRKGQRLWRAQHLGKRHVYHSLSRLMLLIYLVIIAQTSGKSYFASETSGHPPFQSRHQIRTLFTTMRRVALTNIMCKGVHKSSHAGHRTGVTYADQHLNRGWLFQLSAYCDKLNNIEYARVCLRMPGRS